MNECKHRVAEIREYLSDNAPIILYKRICKRCGKELPKLNWTV